jgi:RNA polymerase sigma-70 factor (ECF subfamily)
LVDDLTSQDDRALVEAALRDRNAYAHLVRRYEPPLMRYVRRLLGPGADSAEDVLQEAFIKAFINLNDYDRSRPFSPWIYRIAHNEAMNFLRKRRIQPPVIGGEDGRLILERLRDGTLLNENTGPDRINKIATALNGLDQAYRDVLVLRFLEEKGYDDIADILRLPPGTVATRIRRGLARLKVLLQSASVDIGNDRR